MRIPDYREVISNHSDARLNNGQTVGKHVEDLRKAFVREHAGRFINTNQALDFVKAQLPYLPATEQAAVAKQLVADADRLVNWGPSGGLSSADTRRRQEIVLETLGKFLAESRQETLGVEDLARSLRLERAKQNLTPIAKEGTVNLGSQIVSVFEVAPLAVHRPQQGVPQHQGYVTREGSELAFTGWVPSENGYLQVHTRIDAEKSEGPLTEKEQAAIQKLGATLSEGLGEELIPTRHLGSIGSERTQLGIMARPFEQRRALTDGTYVRVPRGEGVVLQARVNGEPSVSSFSVGPAFFSVSHNTTAVPFADRLADGGSFQVVTTNGSHTLQLQVPLANGNVVFASLVDQPSAEAARLQLGSLLELTRRVFS